MPKYAILGPMLSGVPWEIHAADCQAIGARQDGRRRRGNSQHGSNAPEPSYEEHESPEAARTALLADLEANDTPHCTGDVKIHSCTRRKLPSREQIKRQITGTAERVNTTKQYEVRIETPDGDVRSARTRAKSAASAVAAVKRSIPGDIRSFYVIGPALEIGLNGESPFAAETT